ncbi:hypothetical protein KR76_00158 [Pimelobacter simplex]|uniref:Uncharacterized protein n=1 Tax=Nocardioides simplex TaxID=2045 RepID=A0A0C5XMW4_NOCSI|nr:hypothetical protein KR76_00158 [Pimelobacter simplex]
MGQEGGNGPGCHQAELLMSKCLLGTVALSVPARARVRRAVATGRRRWERIRSW